MSVSATSQPAEDRSARWRKGASPGTGARRMSRALQAIVFDFDGVIADSEPLHLRAFQHTLSDLGVTLTTEDYYAKYLGYDDAGVFINVARDCGIALADEQVTSLVARKGDTIQDMLRAGEVLFPGTADFI